MNGINDIVTNITNMYLAFNKDLDAKLPEDVVFSLIPNRGRSKYLGWFAASRWTKGDNRLHEINIASDFLNRNVDDIAETLIHEMAHLKNSVEGIKDCTPTQYYNRAFKKQAEAFGLKVDKMRNKGYALTALNEKAQVIVDTYKKNILEGNNPFIIHRVSDVKPSRINPKKSVAIDRGLADEIMDKQGGKLSGAVDIILREWLLNNGD